MTSMMVDDRLQEAFSDDVGSLWCRPIAVLDRPPDSLSFLRGERAEVAEEGVGSSRPTITITIM